MKSILAGRVMGGLMLFIITCAPFVIKFGVAKAVIVIMGILFLIGWILIAVWLLLRI